jgi:hypothetical protein
MSHKSSFYNHAHDQGRREQLLRIHEHFAARGCNQEPRSSHEGQITIIKPGVATAYVRRYLTGRAWGCQRWSNGLYEKAGAHRFDFEHEVIAHLERRGF